MPPLFMYGSSTVRMTSGLRQIAAWATRSPMVPSTVRTVKSMTFFFRQLFNDGVDAAGLIQILQMMAPGRTEFGNIRSFGADLVEFRAKAAPASWAIASK